MLYEVITSINGSFKFFETHTFFLLKVAAMWAAVVLSYLPADSISASHLALIGS